MMEFLKKLFSCKSNEQVIIRYKSQMKIATHEDKKFKQNYSCHRQRQSNFIWKYSLYCSF